MNSFVKHMQRYDAKNNKRKLRKKERKYFLQLFATRAMLQSILKN